MSFPSVLSLPDALSFANAIFQSFGWPEIVIILVVVLIIFGVGKLPQVGGAIGKSIREFRKARLEDDDEDKSKTKAVTTSGETESKEKS